MISIDEARFYVLKDLSPLTPREFELAQALGCVAARLVTASEPSPRFANSAMDGFALRALDTLGGMKRLRITRSIFAGDASDARLEAGEAARIMTGAPIPPGADSVCMREEATVEGDDTVLIQREVAPGEFVRLVGDDFAEGQALLQPGDELGPALVGVLASQGAANVLAHPRPRVGVLSTGNELSDEFASLAAGKIRDSNRPTLLASLAQSGFEPVDLGLVGDTKEEIARGFQRGIDSCDAVVSTGGVSVGDADFVKVVIGELCGESARSMQVAMKPGKPFAFGVARSNGVPLFGLAGNPVSTLVGFEVFVRPALRRLGGHRVLDRLTLNAVLDEPMTRKADGKVHLVHVVSRVHDDGHLHVERMARHASHLLHAAAESNSLVVLADGEGAARGDEVRVIVLDSDQLSRD
ncbi:MAG: molybdenum cofactor synthesis domain [Acidimicrobiaceae bacterium]|nr:molybdenum cofactor synthesis domain [Acidimicrobiaceae bacterium]